MDDISLLIFSSAPNRAAAMMKAMPADAMPADDALCDYARYIAMSRAESAE